MNYIGLKQGETERIPWTERHVTFILISGETITADKTGSKFTIIDNLKPGDVLLAAWTGQYSTDIFLVDPAVIKETELYKEYRKAVLMKAKEAKKRAHK